MARRRVTQKPTVFLAIAHPDYESECENFATSCQREQVERYRKRALERGDIRALFPGSIDSPPLPDSQIVNKLKHQIEEGHVDAVFRAIRVVGLWSFPGQLGEWVLDRLPEGSVPDILREQFVVRRLAQKAIHGWTTDAVLGQPHERRRARALLLRVGEALPLLPMGDPRGRIGQAHPFVVTSYFWKEVFRWQQARTLLRVWPGTRRAKVDAVREAYGLRKLCHHIRLQRKVHPLRGGIVSEEQLLGYLGVRPDGSVVGHRPLDPERIAEIVVAKAFKLTAQRVANIVSDHPRFSLLQADLMLT